MKYALERLEDLIENSYNPILFKGKRFTEDQLPAWSQSVTNEVKHITVYLRRRACNITNERAFELLIHQYQVSIINLLDKVYRYEKEADSISLSGAYLLILDCLSELLSFISKNFPQYFNSNEKAPEIYLQLSKKDVKRQLVELQKTLKRKVAEEEMLRICLEPFVSFTKASAKDIKYSRLLYIKELLNQLQRFTKTPGKLHAKPINELVELLVYMNFNSAEFVNLIFYRIIETINVLDEQAPKIERLTFYLKDFNQMQEKPGKALNVKAASVKEQVAGWINEEVFYLETKNRLLSVMPAAVAPESIADSDKLIVSVSVDVLALLGRAGKDSKFILNKHLPRHTRTLRNFAGQLT